MKLVVVLRDPVERAYSHYRYLRRYGETDAPFLQAVERHPELVANGLYHRLLCRWWDAFPGERLHLILYDDIVHSPELVARDVFRFLGVSQDHVTDLYHRRISPSIEPRSTTLENMRGWLFRSLVRYGLSSLIVQARRVGLAELYRRLNNRSEAADFRPTHDEREQLLPSFAADLAGLEASTGLDLACWRR